MNKTVLYLCPSPTITDGVIFPDELEEYYYAPGAFAIEESGYMQFNQSYSFLAMHGNNIFSLPLTRTEDRFIFRVNAEQFGYFGFRVIKTEWRYIGNREEFRHHQRFYRLIPLSPRRLEEICMRADFYFVGYSPSLQIG